MLSDPGSSYQKFVKVTGLLTPLDFDLHRQEVLFYSGMKAAKALGGGLEETFLIVRSVNHASPATKLGLAMKKGLNIRHPTLQTRPARSVN